MRLFACLGILLSAPALAAGLGGPEDCGEAGVATAEVAARYAELAALAETALPSLGGTRFAVVSSDEDAERWSFRHDAARGVLRVLYRMAFNNVTEGWSWQTAQTRAGVAGDGDAYRYKFLPLGRAEAETRPRERQDAMPGVPHEVRFVRRDAYYFVFDNPYEFYARHDADDDAGFAAEVPATAEEAERLARPGGVRLMAWARWQAPYRAESTTYWHAIHGSPVDLTLKNRYFFGRLERVWLCAADGRRLARIEGRVPARSP